MWGIPSFYDVIVVTIQYRLGPFGFMTMRDETAPANVGLRDQVKALLWIRFKFCTDGIVKNVIFVLVFLRHWKQKLRNTVKITKNINLLYFKLVITAIS